MCYNGISEKLLEEIRWWAKQDGVEKVILFGSRSRGDFRKASDIDLAIRGGNYINFVLHMEEETSTLLKYDIVNLEGSIQPELLESIQKEGIAIYEEI
ncbi:MAG: nucleotidyltransferase domain-containing protein [Hespellia sp.]|nr:nucleotidyltransferase domain-containing protein [Hespellia sp.]